MTRVSVNSKSFISFRENRRKKRFPFTVETLYYVLCSIVVQSIVVAAFAKVCYGENDDDGSSNGGLRASSASEEAPE